MNKTIGEALAYLDAIVDAVPVPGVTAFVLPAHTALAAADRYLRGRSGGELLLGAQDAHWEAEGSGATGAVSMRMIADAGAVIVELGHSDRRTRFGDTGEIIGRKVRAALDHGLTPLICVGEDAEQRARGAARSVVVGQLVDALELVRADEIGDVLVAYEPYWAIGPGATAAEVSDVDVPIAGLRATIERSSTDGSARGVLYGGSVDETNASELLTVADGLFVGRAAWDPAGFRHLLDLAGEATEQPRKN